MAAKCRIEKNQNTGSFLFLLVYRTKIMQNVEMDIVSGKKNKFFKTNQSLPVWIGLNYERNESLTMAELAER